MKDKNSPLRRVIDWCIVLCILGFTIAQLFSHYTFSKKYLEYMDFSDHQNDSTVAAYRYLEIINSLSSDMNQYIFTGDRYYLNCYFTTLNSREHDELLAFFQAEESELNFFDVVGNSAKVISDFDLHILKLAAVAGEVPSSQMDSQLRNYQLTDEEMALPADRLIQKARTLSLSDEYLNASVLFHSTVAEYEKNIIARNEVIQARYTELIESQTQIQQTMLLLTGAMMLLIVILLYRQMSTINKMLVDEQQYKGALITDAIGVFEVNLTEDTIESILSEKNALLSNELRRHKLTVPCPFSEFLGAVMPNIPPADAAGMERFSSAFFINQYNANNRFITRENWYSLEEDRHVYLRNTLILSKRPDTENIYALVVFRDITAEKLEYDKQHRLVEMSLRSGQQYLEALRSDSFGILEMNISAGTIDHIISDSNDHALARFFEDVGLILPGKITHYLEALSKLVGEDQKNRTPPMDSELLAKFYAKGGRNQNDEFWITMPDGKRLYIKSTMLLRREEGNGDLVSIVILKDYTSQQLEFEAQQMELMQQKARNEAKNRFFSSMSHDIRTPLNGIIGMIDLMRNHVDEKERTIDYLDKIDQSSKHLFSLINDVLDMSAIDSGKVEIVKKPVNIQSVLDECFVLLNSQLLGRDIVFTLENKAPETPVVMSDSTALKKVFMNVLNNAVKFTSDGGKISFKAEYAYSFDGTVLNAKYTVADTGVGMSSEFLKKLYEPFCQENAGARTTYQGTGLGLSIVKQYVDILKGTITVQSEKNKGSTFVIEFPFEISKREEDISEDVGKSLINVSGLHVLLVDDNELNIEIVQMILVDQGAEVTTASNGREAVDAFTSSEEGHFDAIIMDIMMPIMDGLEATKVIRHMALTRKDAETIPIIALTANAFASDLKKTEEAGMTAHLSKPIVPNTLLETLTRCCRGS